MFSSHNSAFVYSSIKEIIKVWARGYGEASFCLDVKNGTAQVNRNFSLGHPYYGKPSKTPMARSSQPKDDGIDAQPKKKPKRKSPSTRRRNQKRSEAYYARQASNENIVLPFSGNILPVSEAADVSIPAASILSSKIDSPSDVSNLSEVKAPMKNQGKKILVDAETVKKQLFQEVSMPTAVKVSAQGVHPSREPSQTSTYQKREDDLMKKLFS